MTRSALLLALLAVVATGCTRTRAVTRTEVVEVRVPVAVAPASPPDVVRPALPIALIGEETTDGEVAQLYVATVLVLQGYAAELERLLDAYRPRSDATPEGPARDPVVPPDPSRPGPR